MTTEKKTKKAVKTDRQRLQEADYRITELVAEALDARDHAIARSMELADALARVERLEDHARELRRYMVATWRVNDLLRDMVVGAERMPDGRPYRDHLRDGLVSGWTGIVPGVPETNLNEDGPDADLRDGRLLMGRLK